MIATPVTSTRHLGRGAVSFDEVYSLGPCLARGAYSRVHACRERRPGGDEFAVKLIDKANCSAARLEAIKAGLAIRAGLPRHPHIVPLRDIFDGAREFALVMPLVRGGELFERIVARRRYAERDAAEVLRKLLATVAFLHARHIAHRDLKPENILLNDEDDVKIADFGLAAMVRQVGEDASFLRHTKCGSLMYAAPEVLVSDASRGYDAAKVRQVTSPGGRANAQLHHLQGAKP